MNTGLFVLFASFSCTAFAVITSVIATSKHRNGFGWFVIGALYPLLGMILAIVVPANPAPEIPDSAHSPKPWWRD
jgi:hypothetical protein